MPAPVDLVRSSWALSYSSGKHWLAALENHAVKLFLIARGQNKLVPVTISPFVIGRAPECQLRPASSLVSGHHCEIWLRGGSAFVRDLGSTNGTFLNQRRLRQEEELHNADQIQVGPLLFGVQIEGAIGANQPTPVPPHRAAGVEDSAPVIVFEETEPASLIAPPVDASGVPTGNTELGLPPATGNERPAADGGAPGKAGGRRAPL